VDFPVYKALPGLENIRKAMENIGKSPVLVEHMDLTSGKYMVNIGKYGFNLW
jgi:hypothetical protein